MFPRNFHSISLSFLFHNLYRSLLSNCKVIITITQVHFSNFSDTVVLNFFCFTVPFLIYSSVAPLNLAEKYKLAAPAPYKSHGTLACHGTPVENTC